MDPLKFIVFFALLIQIALALILVAPLPSGMRQKLINISSKVYDSYVIIQYAELCPLLFLCRTRCAPASL
jgi:hypothetical protein